MNFQKCDPQYESPDLLVAEYLFGDFHDESDYSWFLRKLDRYKNGYSFTGNTCTSTGKDSDTVNSLLVISIVGSESPTCKKASWKYEGDVSEVAESSIGHYNAMFRLMIILCYYESNVFNYVAYVDFKCVL